MNKICKLLVVVVAITAVAVLFLAVPQCNQPIVIEASEDAELLNGGKDHERIHHLDQGAVQLPLFMLLSLKSVNSDKLLINEMQDYGFITRNTEEKPEAMPIGMSTTKVGGMEYTTMNCAVCHTGKIRVDGKAYIIDGAANHFHTMAWAKHVKASLVATLEDPIEFVKFAARAVSKKRIEIKHVDSGELMIDVDLKRIQAKLEEANVVKSGKQILRATELSDLEARDLVYAQSITAMLEAVQEVPSTEMNADAIFDEEANAIEGQVGRDLFTTQQQPLMKSGQNAAMKSDEGFGSLIQLVKYQIDYGNNIMGIVDVLGDFGPGRDDAWSILTKLLCDNKEHNGVIMYGQPSDGAPADALYLNKPAPVKVPNLFSISNYHESGEYVAGDYHFHYDGNTNTMVERNLLQALAIGSVRYYDPKQGGTTTKVKLDALMEAEKYFSSLKIPNFSEAFPEHFDADLAKKGEEVFHREMEITYTDHEGKEQTVRESCHSCHESQPQGREFPIELIQTDPKRWAFFNEKGYKRNMVKLGATASELTNNTTSAQDFDFSKYPEVPKDRKWYTDQTGYYARTLKGVWASPPYLHNGSVRTIRDLLNPASERKNYYLGSRNYDVENLGYMDDKEMDPNNSGDSIPAYYLKAESYTDEKGVYHPAINGGHEFGVHFSSDDKSALIEYLKVLGN